jgi:hypothetical protein
MKTTRTHIPSSPQKIWDFQLVISFVCPSLLLGNQIKTLHHISNTVSTTTNQLNPTLSTDALSISFSSPASQAAASSASQQFPRIVWSSKVHYSLHKRSQMSLSHARWMQSTHSPSHFKVNFNIVFQSMTRTSKLYLTCTVTNSMQPAVTTWCSYVLVRESNAKLLTNRNGDELGVTWRCALTSI